MRFGSINATNTSIQITQYLCSRCHTVLKETAVSEETGAFNILFYKKKNVQSAALYFLILLKEETGS